MGSYESFGKCLQRVLDEAGMSASEAARKVGFRSRNSIFRILNDDTSCEVDARFLASLREAAGGTWPQRHWQALEKALCIKRVGLERYENSQSFFQALYGGNESRSFMVETAQFGPEVEQVPLTRLLTDICADAEVTVVICGCMERNLAAQLAACFGEAGEHGRLTIRHYIDIQGSAAVHNILALMPLMSKVWYNARLVEEEHCPAETAALYRSNIINLRVQHRNGRICSHQLLQYDRELFIHVEMPGIENRFVHVLDRCRFQLEMLKPMALLKNGTEDYVKYTDQYAQLEKDGMILSIKPDIHFNLVPAELLYQAIMEGFEQSGMTHDQAELGQLMVDLAEIHAGRERNMWEKRRPTHLVYSLPAMERFMRTGVQTDHFFVQRAYTPEERRAIIGRLLRQAREDPFFNVYFLKAELPELRHEMTFYEGKGVLLMDAYTGYDLHDDHSEALITLPAFMESFQRFFMEELLDGQTMSGTESMAVLERLMNM